MGEIIVFTIIGVLFGLLILVFLYISILYKYLDVYDSYENEHNFRRKEKEYKENNSFIEDLEKEEKYLNWLKDGKRKIKSND